MCVALGYHFFLTSSSAEVKEWLYISTPHVCFHGVDRAN